MEFRSIGFPITDATHGCDPPCELNLDLMEISQLRGLTAKPLLSPAITVYYSIKDILALSDTCKLSRNMLQNVFTVLFEHMFVFIHAKERLRTMAVSMIRIQRDLLDSFRLS